MSFKKKLIHELIVIFWTTLYFMVWIGVLVGLKTLILEEYKIGFYEYSIIIVGALVAAKVVIILENISLGSWAKNSPSIVEVIIRTLMYLLGIFIVMVLEKAFELRHEYGGFVNAIKELPNQSEFYHILANTICVFGALLGFNLYSIIKKNYGKNWLSKILSAPAPSDKK